MTTSRSIWIACAALALAGTAAAVPVTFSTGDPDGKMAMATRPDLGGKIEIETGDDFIVTSGTTHISAASFTGLVTSGVAAPTIGSVVVEIYRIFPLDSDTTRTITVPTRANSPSDVAFVERSSGADFSVSTTTLNPSFTAANSVLNGINPKPAQNTLGEGPVTGAETRLDVSFSNGIDLAPGHYFFVPQVQVTGGEFYWLSAPKPIVGGTPFLGDLQAWIRNEALDPDWLRVGTDIVGGNPAPTFNASFTLSAVPEVPSGSLMLVGLAAVATVLRRRAEKRSAPSR